MLNRYLKSRIPDAKRLVEQLSKHYDYVSILGSFVNTKRIVTSTRIDSSDDVDNECGFVIKVYKDGRYSEYSCNDIRDLKAGTVKASLTLSNAYSAKFSVAMLQEKDMLKTS